MNSFEIFLRRLAALLALPLALFWATPAQACTGGGCAWAGPRLASVSSTQGAILNTLLGSLANSSLSVSAVDWNAVATGDVSLLKTLSALQTTLNVATPQAALNAPVTLAQLSGAMSTAASQDGLTSLSVALGDLSAQLGAAGTVKLGDLLTSDGLVGTTRLNALSLVSGAIQLFNTKNVLTTPSPITLSGTSLGLAGVVSQVQLSAQAIEPPVYVCGPVGSTFHTSAIRVKLAITLLSLTPDTSVLSALGLGAIGLTLGQLQVYVELAEASGVITAVNAISNAMTVQATPGIASLYLGTMADSVFFDRTHTISVSTDLGPATIGSLTLGTSTLAIQAQAAATGTAPTPTTMSFSGTGVQTQTATTAAGFETSLVSSLLGNLSISISPDLGIVIDTLLLAPLNALVQSTVQPVLATLLSGLVDPLLSSLGVRLGEVDVSSGGAYLECGIAGCVYADANHNARQDSGEAGTGATLYAKLLPSGATAASLVVTIDPTTGNYSFPTLNPGTYTVVVGTSSSAAVVTPAAPTGWIATETPTLSRSLTIATADLSGRNFGLYHGSTIAGTIFRDDGSGGGAANNGVKDGTEAAIGNAPVGVTDTTGATVYDSERTDATGAYLLWVPSTAGATALKVAQAADATSVFVSGSAGTTGGAFALATAATTFTNTVGSAYTGVDFGDVPINRLDTDGQQSIAPGATAYYAHAFHAGSAGQVNFGVAPLATPAAGWSATVWLDANCNGQLDTGEAQLTGATAVVASQTLCVIVKVFVPQTAASDTRATYVLTASFAYANNTLTASAQHQDLTIVGSANGLQLVKTVDKTVATSGTVITYTLTYVNQGASPASAIKIHDATPAWTVLAAASCGTLPAGVTACNVTAQPAVGAAGSLEWTLTGTVPGGGSGTVQFSVTVQ